MSWWQQQRVRERNRRRRSHNKQRWWRGRHLLSVDLCKNEINVFFVDWSSERDGTGCEQRARSLVCGNTDIWPFSLGRIITMMTIYYYGMWSIWNSKAEDECSYHNKSHEIDWVQLRLHRRYHILNKVHIGRMFIGLFFFVFSFPNFWFWMMVRGNEQMSNRWYVS